MSAKEIIDTIAEQYGLDSNDPILYPNKETIAIIDKCKWKDEEVKKSLIRFMKYLDRRGFIAEDIDYDIEHQVETFLKDFNHD